MMSPPYTLSVFLALTESHRSRTRAATIPGEK